MGAGVETRTMSDGPPQGGDTPPPTATRLYRVEQVAEILGVSERYVWQLAIDGVLRRVVLASKAVRFRDDDVRAYIDRQTKPAPDE